MKQKEKTMRSVAIGFFLRDLKERYSVYLKLGDKYIEFSNDSRVDQDRIDRLRHNGIKELFLTEGDYKRYLAQRVDQLFLCKISEESSLEMMISFYGDHLELLKDTLTCIGLKPQQIQILKSLQDNSIKMVSSNKDLQQLFETFNSHNQKSIVFRTYLEAQITIGILSKAATFDSLSLSKVNMALLIKDVLLSEEECSAHFASEALSSSQVQDHGVLLCEKLFSEANLEFKSDLISNLLIKHHEKPDGSGFPNNINFTRFDLTLAVYSLVNQFVDLLIGKELKPCLIKDCASQVLKDNLKYSSASNFCKALELFSATVLNKDVCFE